MGKDRIAVFWFRRDLRLEDNVGLYKALESGLPVLPMFIFDTNITDELPRDDSRITFIHDQLATIHEKLHSSGSSLLCLKGNPLDVWKELLTIYSVETVFTNEDYEPYARERDGMVNTLLKERGVSLQVFKDQVIFAKDEILKGDGKPYTVYTPYKNKWLAAFNSQQIHAFESQNAGHFLQETNDLPSLSDLGFERSSIEVSPFDLDDLDHYADVRNIPHKDQTSHLSPHLRFGTIGIRTVVSQVKDNAVFLSELIWREFFMQILWHFPQVVDNNFKSKYDDIQWRNNPEEFERWKNGQTGYPIVDAGMRELNETGFMHNRVRMITAGFLCKHLLINWQWGEAYFAEKLLDYELASNNGNWQWSAGTGCDAAPYFRVFNPTEQVKKFDPDLKYIKRWVPELETMNYPAPMVEHKFARQRAIDTYKIGLQNS